MFLGRVIGTVWATRKDPRLEGLSLQVVRELDTELQPQQRFVIAVDVVQAGVGDVVLVSQGSAARQSPVVEGRPIDALIMAVVDDLQVAEMKELQAAHSARVDALAAHLEAQPES